MAEIVKKNSFGEFVILFDETDRPLINMANWQIQKGRRTFYARGRIKKKYRKPGDQIIVRLHRFILDCPEDMQVDHKDGNGLNNQRDNLRITSNLENSKNKRLSIDSTTGYKGVTFQKKKKLYHARIRVNGKLISGGRSKYVLVAARKYNELSIKHFGEYACLNKIPNE